MDRIPILRMGEFLLVTIQVDMHDQMALRLQDDLTARIGKTGARGVLIDISALEMVDSFIGRMIADISVMSRINERADRFSWNAACGRDYAGRTGPDSGRGQDRLERRAGYAMAQRTLPRKAPMPVTKSETMPLRSEQDVVLARQAVRKITQEAGFTPGRSDQDGDRRQRTRTQCA